MMCSDCGRGAHKGPCEPREEEEAPGGPRYARVEDEDEKLVGYVNAPRGTHRLPAYIRDASTGKVYKAELDDFCTFACYREIAVETMALKATHA